MASATQLGDSTPATVNLKLISSSGNDILEDAVNLAARLKEALTILQLAPEMEFDESGELEVIQGHALALTSIDDSLFDALPKRKRRPFGLAEATATLLYPAPECSLSPVIRYEHDRILLRKRILLQRRYKDLLKARQREQKVRLEGIKAQGPWDPEKQPISLAGTPALPMPVEISDAFSLGPFFRHLKQNGTSDMVSLAHNSVAGDFSEPFYGTKGLEFPKGVLYDDGRMDLCKKVVGPQHIGSLLQSLRTNTFVKHFLLGNNIIGPTGAKHIAEFVNDYPDRIDTWYLAGNCIDGASFSKLVDAFVKSPSITNIWLKRNPLGASAANDLFRLITQSPNLRTLDLDQTEIGDAGAAELFEKLAQHEGRTCLDIIYLNGNGIGVAGATAIGNYMASKHCCVRSIYMANNPLGSKGVAALASGLKHNRTLTRLMLASSGMSDIGAVHLFAALSDHPTLRVLDIGASIATADLGQAYNYLTDAAAPSLAVLIDSVSTLEYLNLGICPMTHMGFNTILEAAVESASLLIFLGKPVFNLGREYTKSERDHSLRLQRELSERQKENVRVKYGGMDNDEFHKSEKRWILSDKESVRKIDSVYRNRDMALARQGLIRLKKQWEESDETLAEVAGYME
jgi:Ran GTPase-activating protein (RanGAP) involved in mRNA processing and transport